MTSVQIQQVMKFLLLLLHHVPRFQAQVPSLEHKVTAVVSIRPVFQAQVLLMAVEEHWYINGKSQQQILVQVFLI